METSGPFTALPVMIKVMEKLQNWRVFIDTLTFCLIAVGLSCFLILNVVGPFNKIKMHASIKSKVYCDSNGAYKSIKISLCLRKCTSR